MGFTPDKITSSVSCRMAASANICHRLPASINQCTRVYIGTTRGAACGPSLLSSGGHRSVAGERPLEAGGLVPGAARQEAEPRDREPIQNALGRALVLLVWIARGAGLSRIRVYPRTDSTRRCRSDVGPR